MYIFQLKLELDCKEILKHFKFFNRIMVPWNSNTENAHNNTTNAFFKGLRDIKMNQTCV